METRQHSCSVSLSRVSDSITYGIYLMHVNKVTPLERGGLEVG